MAYAARLDKPEKDGSTPRSHYKRKAQQLLESDGPDSAVYAQAMLQVLGPTYPACAQYLLQWLNELSGRSGEGMNGLAPLTYATITHWARWTQRRPLPHEITALLDLDSVRRHPPPEDEHDV